MGTWLPVVSGRVAGASARVTLAVSLLALLALASVHWPAVLEASMLDWPAVRAGQVWRLWTGHLAHTDLMHAGMNLAVVALLAAMAEQQQRLASLLWGSLLLMPAISVGLLLLAPGLEWYVGLSGLLHGWAAWLLLWRGGSLATMGLFALVLKLAWEAAADASSAGVVPVATEAHRLGVLFGLLMAVGTRSRMGIRRCGTERET